MKVQSIMTAFDSFSGGMVNLGWACSNIDSFSGTHSSKTAHVSAFNMHAALQIPLFISQVGLSNYA